ncbi:MAG: alpha-hydroxy-acid oxidizing protein [Caulobacteraceae bacterium]
MFIGAAGGFAASPGLSWAQDAPAYEPPSAVKSLKPFDLEELEAQAAKVLAPGPFAFLSGGVGAEWTLHQNRSAFGHFVIEPQYLAGKPPPDLSHHPDGHEARRAAADHAGRRPGAVPRHRRCRPAPRERRHRGC